MVFYYKKIIDKKRDLKFTQCLKYLIFCIFVIVIICYIKDLFNKDAIDKKFDFEFIPLKVFTLNLDEREYKLEEKNNQKCIKANTKVRFNIQLSFKETCVSIIGNNNLISLISLTYSNNEIIVETISSVILLLQQDSDISSEFGIYNKINSNQIIYCFTTQNPISLSFLGIKTSTIDFCFQSIAYLIK